MTSSRNTVTGIVAVAVILAAASVLAFAAAGGAFDHGCDVRTGVSCVVPTLPGTVVDATLINMGGPMMQGSGRSMMGGIDSIVTRDGAPVSKGTGPSSPPRSHPHMKERGRQLGSRPRS